MLRELLSDGTNSSENLRFPSHEELELMPVNIRESLIELVFESLRRTLYPRFLFIVEHRRHMVEENALRGSVPALSSGFLSSLVCFHKWANLDQVSKAFTFRFVRPNTIVQLQGVVPTELIIVAGGQLHCRRREGPPTCKGFPDSCTTPTRVISALKCVDDKTFFTEFPATETIKSSSNPDSKCLVWTLPKRKYEEFFAEQTAEKQQAVRASCYPLRRDQIPKEFPVTANILQHVNIFSSVPVSMLQSMILKLEPKTFWENEFLCQKGHCDSIAYLVARGVVEVQFDDPVQNSLYTEPWTMWGEVSLLFSKRMPVNVRAVTNCDVYVLNRDALTAVNSTSVMADVLTAAHAIAEGQQEQAKQRFLPMITKLPLLPKSTSSALFRLLLQELTSVVYPVNSTITSSSEACDRLIIPVRGRARISSRNQDLRIGEAIGFTCLRPHRWKFHVFAVEAVQTLEIRAARYRDILSNTSVLKFVEDCVDGLLFPNVFPASFSAAIATMHELQNPPMFEPSLATVVTPLEPRGTVLLPKIVERNRCNKFRYMITATTQMLAESVDCSMDQKQRLRDEVDAFEQPTIKKKRSFAHQPKPSEPLSSPAMRSLFLRWRREGAIPPSATVQTVVKHFPPQVVEQHPQQLSVFPFPMADNTSQTDASFLQKLEDKMTAMTT